MTIHDIPQFQYDVLMIGAGPANLAVATALEDMAPAIAARTIMLEANDEIVWQPGLLCKDALSQVNYVKDLATMRDPRSRFTFLNYLHSIGQIDDFINMGSAVPYREEVSRYHAWVADELRNVKVRTGQRVAKVTPERRSISIAGWRVETVSGEVLMARHVIFGIGRDARIPQEFAGLSTDRVIHSTRFSQSIEAFKGQDIQRVAVIGSAQSAAEMALEIGHMFPDAQRDVIMRSIGMVGYETSKFTNELFFPDFIDKFNAMPEEARADVLSQMHTANYSGLAPHTLDALFAQKYQAGLSGKSNLSFQTLSHVTEARLDDDGRVVLATQSRCDGERQETYDLVLLGTGFEPEMPRLLQQFAETTGISELKADLLYRVDTGRTSADDALCFIQGVNEATHGIGDSLLSNQASRAAKIATCLMEAIAEPACHNGRIKPLDPAGLVFENGLYAQRLLPFPITTPFESSWCVLSPGTGSTPHAHHEYEIFVALEGEATVEVDGQELPFVKGDTIHFEPGTRHKVINRSDKDFIMYSIWWDDAMSLRQLAAHRGMERLVS